MQDSIGRIRKRQVYQEKDNFRFSSFVLFFFFCHLMLGKTLYDLLAEFYCPALMLIMMIEIFSVKGAGPSLIWLAIVGMNSGVLHRQINSAKYKVYTKKKSAIFFIKQLIFLLWKINASFSTKFCINYMKFSIEKFILFLYIYKKNK